MRPPDPKPILSAAQRKERDRAKTEAARAAKMANVAARRQAVLEGDASPDLVRKVLRLHRKMAKAFGLPELEISAEDAREVADLLMLLGERTEWRPSGGIFDLGSVALTVVAVYRPIVAAFVRMIFPGKASPAASHAQAAQPGAPSHAANATPQAPPGFHAPSPAPASPPAMTIIRPPASQAGEAIVQRAGGAYTVSPSMSPAPSTLAERMDDP